MTEEMGERQEEAIDSELRETATQRRRERGRRKHFTQRLIPGLILDSSGCLSFFADIPGR
jgi:hypothetical protein